MNDDVIKRGLEHMRQQRPTTFVVPEFSVDDVEANNGFKPAGNIAAMPTPFTLPDFTDDEITSPDGEFVSALSSPSVPSCTSRGTGGAHGKLVQVGISANGDDGTVVFSVFYNDRVWFGTCEPAI